MLIRTWPVRSPLEFFILRFHPQTLQCEGLRSDSGICIFNELPKWSFWAPGFGNPGAIAFLYRCAESCALLLNHRTRPQLLQVAEGPSCSDPDLVLLPLFPLFIATSESSSPSPLDSAASSLWNGGVSWKG